MVEKYRGLDIFGIKGMLGGENAVTSKVLKYLISTNKLPKKLEILIEQLLFIAEYLEDEKISKDSRILFSINHLINIESYLGKCEAPFLDFLKTSVSMSVGFKLTQSIVQEAMKGVFKVTRASIKRKTELLKNNSVNNILQKIPGKLTTHLLISNLTGTLMKKAKEQSKLDSKDTIVLEKINEVFIKLIYRDAPGYVKCLDLDKYTANPKNILITPLILLQDTNSGAHSFYLNAKWEDLILVLVDRLLKFFDTNKTRLVFTYVSLDEKENIIRDISININEIADTLSKSLASLTYKDKDTFVACLKSTYKKIIV